ncbi:MAG TPA: glycosyltransferase family 1 protein [Gaiellaceae bacterium]|nr:glycosyltransferase family 1 protein [Gaiellaceae bacterium]
MSGDLRVALSGLGAAGRSGVPRYAGSLLRALDRVAPEFDRLRLELLTTPAGADVVKPAHLELQLVGRTLGWPHAGGRRIVAEQLAARTHRANLLHFFDLTGPLLAPRRPFVTTLHDVAIAHDRRPFLYAYKRRVQPWALRTAKAAVAVSSFARDEAVARLGADPARITVVRSGPGLEPTGTTRTNGAMPRDFILYVGDLTLHKNLPFLLDVFEDADLSAQLVLVGRRGERYPEIRDRIRRSSAAERIAVVEDADDARVDSLYRHALATVLPSRYEGFGFTPLEAMARDCPVLASDIPALRETAGDGALLLPLDARSQWVDALRRVAHDEALRAELRARGRANVARYSWDDAARTLCRLFLRVTA